MPKLAKNIASKVESTETVHSAGGSYEPIEPGKYFGRLASVKVRPETNKYDAPQWSAEFEELHQVSTGDRAPGRQWLNLTIPTTKTPHPQYTNGADKWEMYQNMLAGRLHAFFEALGYTSDSDTDEMLGEWAVLTISVETIQYGTRAGERTNRVTDIEAVPAGFEPPVELVGAVAADEAW